MQQSRSPQDERNKTMNKTGFPMYEGDSLIRPAMPLDPVSLDTIERDARAMRGQAIGQLLERFFNWMERSAWRARQRDTARFLSGAIDHADLERRIKSLHNATRMHAG